MRRPARLAVAAAAVILVAGIALLARTLRYGFSARDQPTAIESTLARAMRRYAVPADLRHRTNPVTLTPAVLEDARAHFADHCASCHGNDGKGQTAMGQGLYPKAPDMTGAETQSQSDGALFATIENGIRLTGMPAWGNGTADSAASTWALVHFIRHLPQITADEIEEMKALNPKTRAELAEEDRERRFLDEDGT